MVGSVHAATLRRGAVGLAIWAAAAAALSAMLAALEPDVIDVWSDMGYLSAFGGAAGVEASYWTFTTSLLPAVLAGYVVSQTSTWVGDLFWAFSAPYAEWPSASQLVTLLAVATAGAALAVAVAERSPSVP